MSFEGWKEVRLSKIMEIVGGGTPKSSVDEYWNGSIPWLSVKDFNNEFRKVYTTEKTITELGLSNSSTKLLNKGDLIISARGTVGVLAQLGKPMTFNQSCYGLRAKPPITNDFLYYLLKSNMNHLKRNTHGSVFDTITRGTFDSIEVDLPPEREQRLITSILSSLDEKIELNHRINQNLEEMAQAIFKSWFIDFEPFQEGEFVESELGPIPKGWEVVQLKDVIDILDSKRIPLSKKQREKRVGEFPYYGAAGIVDYIDSYIFDGVHVLVGEDGSVVDDNENPYVQYVWGKFWVNNHAHVLKGKSYISDEILYCFLKRVNIRPYITGAVQLKLNQGNLKRIPFILPPESICREIGRKLTEIFQLLKKNKKENITLSSLRDTLLPKLMSGEIRVPLEKEEALL